MKIRKALLSDAPGIQKLINEFADKDLMLPRSLNHIYENIRDYYVAEEKGRMIGCAALHIVWGDLAEVNSLAVRDSHKGKGTGRALVSRCLDEARGLGIRRVFALTYVPKFFRKCGFSRIAKSKLPQKIWSDCLNCHKFPDCGEVSVAVDIDR
ncbi:MAG TPA: N-acetyltransferase [bacterium]|jgi:amino-acid N-acetyltransferase|nr:N-acetyltransferase [Chlamydiota bacterium]HOE28120.1 N-acetyltransferase [bacterium]HQM52940.1 N-acetyltransferase [bacterium]